MPMTMKQVESRLDAIDNLPTLPTIAAQLLDKLKNNTISMRTISTIMENDPAITTKVLKVANSAYYSLRNRVDTIRMALVVLGVNEVTNIILGLSIFKAFDEAKSVAHFDVSQFWMHSILTSQVARYLAKILHQKTHGEEFTGGLIHSIGRMILLLYFQPEFIEIMKQHNDLHLPLVQAERMHLGTTHMEVGAWLASKWRLPNNLIDCIRYYQNPAMSVVFKDLSALINLGHYYADEIINKRLEKDFNEFRELEGWEVLRSQRYLVDVKKFYTDLEAEAEKAKDYASNLLS